MTNFIRSASLPALWENLVCEAAREYDRRAASLCRDTDDPVYLHFWRATTHIYYHVDEAPVNPPASSVRDEAYGWIRSLPLGSCFDLEDLYDYLSETFASLCSERGDAPTEPRYRNDARWARQDASIAGLLETISRGRFRRVEPCRTHAN